MYSKFSILFNPNTHRGLYILLLITTPFLLLQNYLQSLIGEISDLSVSVFDINTPITLLIAFALILTILLISYNKLNKLRITSWLIIALLFWIGQKSTDYYFNHKFYELQYNWHFIAYSIFAFLNYRVLKNNNASPSKIILLTFVYTLLISTFDEAIQIPLSNRIFDVGDISKDLWGSMIGLVFIFFILENGKIIDNGWKIRRKTLREYTKNPLSLLIIEFVFAYLFMVSSSLLTSTQYILVSIFIPTIATAIIFTIVHLSQNKISRIAFIILFSGLIITQGIYLYKYSDKGISYNNNKLLIYKGIPIYFFDVMIFPDGTFRLVDKKKSFNQRDVETILDKCENILIISSGNDNSGGKGFPSSTITQFIFNKKTMQGVQLIIRRNKKACTSFNELNTAGKRPTLIFHNN